MTENNDKACRICGASAPDDEAVECPVCKRVHCKGHRDLAGECYGCRHERKLKKNPPGSFFVTVDLDITMDVNEIWPDGDAPENPTVKDVVNVMEECSYSPINLLSEWSLDRYLTITVTDGKGGRGVYRG